MRATVLPTPVIGQGAPSRRVTIATGPTRGSRRRNDRADPRLPQVGPGERLLPGRAGEALDVLQLELGGGLDQLEQVGVEAGGELLEPPRGTRVSATDATR
ncbi:hypothetical protein ASF82_10330 [Frigoribacterium sp. Leaf164]|nr:hypothetical protein ASF82_10330 [Frigoribacterium sp. Leaf164]